MDTGVAPIDLESLSTSPADVALLSATGFQEFADKDLSLLITTDDKDDLLKMRQATIGELTKKVAYLQSRENELLALSKRYKARVRKLQSAFDILKQSIAKIDNAIRENDVVSL
ncbi:hypothetical protein GGI17_003989 [Coemansia sp. S146]|nr:hypothetical protein GGI17_003989 [Coemansia sp. S146]